MAKRLSPLDMGRCELRNVILQILASTPVGQLGFTYYDSAIGSPVCYDGTAFIPLDPRKHTGSIPIAALVTNPLARGSHTGTQLASTISDLDSTIKAYKLSDLAAPSAAVSLNNQKITNLATPTAAGDAAEYNWVLAQVQAAAAGIDNKPSCRALASANITLSGLQTLDGVTLAAGDRVLCVGQTTASQNGVYVAAAAAWARAGDTITPQTFWLVEEGTTNKGSQWKVSTTGAIVLGSTNLTINQWGSGNSYSAGNGLALGGSTFSVQAVASGGVAVSSSGVSVDRSFVPFKYSANIGDGSSTSITVTHGLNTQDVTYSLRMVSDNTPVEADVVPSTVNTVTVTTAVAIATNAVRIVVTG